MFKVDTKTTQWRRFGVFIVNFEHISHLCSSASVIDFEHVIAGWVVNLNNSNYGVSSELIA